MKIEAVSMMDMATKEFATEQRHNDRIMLKNTTRPAMAFFHGNDAITYKDYFAKNKNIKVIVSQIPFKLHEAKVLQDMLMCALFPGAPHIKIEGDMQVKPGFDEWFDDYSYNQSYHTVFASSRGYAFGRWRNEPTYMNGFLKRVNGELKTADADPTEPGMKRITSESGCVATGGEFVDLISSHWNDFSVFPRKVMRVSDDFQYNYYETIKKGKIALVRCPVLHHNHKDQDTTSYHRNVHVKTDFESIEKSMSEFWNRKEKIVRELIDDSINL
jgi:hypothetical protein